MTTNLPSIFQKYFFIQKRVFLKFNLDFLLWYDDLWRIYYGNVSRELSSDQFFSIRFLISIKFTFWNWEDFGVLFKKTIGPWTWTHAQSYIAHKCPVVYGFIILCDPFFSTDPLISHFIPSRRDSFNKHIVAKLMMLIMYFSVITENFDIHSNE